MVSRGVMLNRIRNTKFTSRQVLISTVSPYGPVSTSSLSQTMFYPLSIWLFCLDMIILDICPLPAIVLSLIKQKSGGLRWRTLSMFRL